MVEAEPSALYQRPAKLSARSHTSELVTANDEATETQSQSDRRQQTNRVTPCTNGCGPFVQGRSLDPGISQIL
jgi:hypothetical protein